MNQFMNQSPEFLKLQTLEKEASDLVKNNKLVEAAEIYQEILKQINDLPNEVKSVEPESTQKFELEIREKLTETKFKLEDYDSAIEEGLKILEKTPVYVIYLKVGICYFKKGKYYKARENLLKAKELFTGETEKICKIYLL
jgi:tetratricopeptide (TPR) repeat protein